MLHFLRPRALYWYLMTNRAWNYPSSRGRRISTSDWSQCFCSRLLHRVFYNTLSQSPATMLMLTKSNPLKIIYHVRRKKFVASNKKILISMTVGKKEILRRTFSYDRFFNVKQRKATEEDPRQQMLNQCCSNEHKRSVWVCTIYVILCVGSRKGMWFLLTLQQVLKSL